jgi:hypothetical protein
MAVYRQRFEWYGSSIRRPLQRDPSPFSLLRRAAPTSGSRVKIMALDCDGQWVIDSQNRRISEHDRLSQSWMTAPCDRIGFEMLWGRRRWSRRRDWLAPDPQRKQRSGGVGMSRHCSGCTIASFLLVLAWAKPLDAGKISKIFRNFRSLQSVLTTPHSVAAGQFSRAVFVHLISHLSPRVGSGHRRRRDTIELV